jgi:hypothetical protein
MSEPYRTPGDVAKDRHFIDDESRYLHERIAESVAMKLADNVHVGRRCIVNPILFWELIRQLSAKIESGPYGEYVVLVTSAGVLYVVPDPDMPKRMGYRFEGDR